MKQSPFFRSWFFFCAVLSVSSLLVSCEKDEETKPEPPALTLKLEYMEVVEIPLAGELHLYGFFGDSSTSASVLINGNRLPDATPSNLGSRILSWKPWEIVCQIDAVTAPMGKGTVQVRNQGAVSNTRKITAWHGDILFHRPDEGTLEREVRFEVYLRADAESHKYPVPRTPLSHFASGSQAHFQLGGQGTSTFSSDCQVTLIATIDPASGIIYPRFPLTDGPNKPDYFRSKINFADRKFNVEYLDVFKEKVSTLTMTSINCPATSTTQIARDLHGPPSEFQTFTLELDPNTKDIKPGKLTHMASTEVGLIWDEWQVPQYECTLEWGTIKTLE